MATLTGATASIALSIASLFPAPQLLKGFTADDVFSTEPIASAETLMGVDGILSGGFVFVPIPMNIMLQADSASNDIFDQWWTAQVSGQDTLVATGVITLRAIGKKWSLTNGFLTSYVPIPPTKKLIQPRTFGITWNQVFPSST